MRLLDGTVWMMALSGRIWTAGRLQAAATTLSAVSGRAVDKSKIERTLSINVGVKEIQLLEPTLDAIDTHRWGISEVATALNQRGSCDGDAESDLTTWLQEALLAFVSTLDPEAKRLSSVGGRLDAATYNYLAYKPHRMYRKQFAEVFPGLVEMTVTGGPESLGEELRELVDNGEPIVKGLAASWGVRPGVVKYLIGKSRDRIGPAWATNMRGLATLINVLRPEDLPTNDSESWQSFDRAISVGKSIFGTQIFKDRAALAWFRECVFRTNRGTDRTRDVWLPGDESLRNIACLKDSLSAALRREFVVSEVAVEADMEEVLRKQTNWFLSRTAGKGLAEMASRFENELHELRQEPAQILGVMRADQMWPLIPRRFVSSDGTRAIEPLTSRPQLAAHGESIANCLAGYAKEGYLRRGKDGKVFIVGILDAKTGQPCSTAEIVVRFGRERLSYSLAVRQHSARRNTKPSKCCSKALKELLTHCQTPEVSDHIEEGWTKIAERRRLKTRQIKEQLDALPAKAAKKTIGEREFEGMLQRIGGQMGLEPDV